MSYWSDISDVQNRFAEIEPVDAQGNRRPHRPLLVLYALGKLEEGERRLSYKQIDQDVGELLDIFGPPHDTSAKYPFWYLRKDGVWEVEDAAEIPQRKGKNQPLVSAMKDRDTHGWFSEDVWAALRGNPYLRHDVAQMMLEKCFPNILHRDILDAVGLSFTPTYYTSKQKK